jgi:competence protein ComEC
MKRLLAVILLASASLLAAKSLEVYFIDVEGGKATLLVSPGGEAMLIDTGYGGNNRRDAERIAAAAKDAGVKKIDYLVITHYHADHVGGVMQLSEKLPIRNFVDHGPSTENTKALEVLLNTYMAARQKGTHILAKPGDKIPVKGLEVQVMSSGGQLFTGIGKPNPECAGAVKQAVDTTENAASLGVLVTFGSFRMLDLGDLSWNKEQELMCPTNPVGTVDVYSVSHHGRETSGPPQLVRAIAPRVAIMNNGARKGGDPAAWRIIRDSPGLEDLWQLHFAVAGGKEHNASDMFIANLDEICEGKWLKLTAQQDGSFTVENRRNRYRKSYPATARR